MSNEPKYRDAEWLREQYTERRRDLTDIAGELGCAVSTISRWLDNHDIETRTRGGWDKNRREERAPDERLTDPEWVREKYENERLTCREIADLCDCSESSVQRWVKNHGIETKGNEFQIADERLADEEWVREQYVEKELTGHEIAEICSVEFSTVYTWLDNHDIEIQNNGMPSGPDHPRWTGGPRAYGPGWNDSKRAAVRERDDHTCQDPRCSVTQADHLDEYDEQLHVHHLRKAREIDDPEERNAPENLITLCRDCHRRWEKIADAGLVPQGVNHASD